MTFNWLRRRGIVPVVLLMLMGGCANREAAQPSTSETEKATAATAPLAPGAQTFVIVPEQSRASYHASEEFFPSALARLGIQAGKAEAVGTTQAIEGRFRFDPEQPAAQPGENTFSVRVNTLTSNQKKRDDYVREVRDDGPSFDAHPIATFRAIAIEGRSDANASGRELNLKLTGDLTVREITKREVFDVKAQLTGNTLVGTATSRLLLSDFGIGPIDFPPLLAVADPVRIEVQFTARAQ
jgi:polyisoprenoid-binding protein YceI